MTMSCSIKGVPRIMEMYNLKMVRTTGFFAILPNEIKSPKGREKISVVPKISKDTHIQSISLSSIIDISIILLLLTENEGAASNTLLICYFPIIVISSPNHFSEILPIVPSFAISSNVS